MKSCEPDQYTWVKLNGCHKLIDNMSGISAAFVFLYWR